MQWILQTSPLTSKHKIGHTVTLSLHYGIMLAPRSGVWVVKRFSNILTGPSGKFQLPKYNEVQKGYTRATCKEGSP